MGMKPLDTIEAPYFQYRARRQRRRGDEVRHRNKVRRYWVDVLHEDPATWTPRFDPRHCSCFLCRGGYLDRVQRREQLAPQVEEG